MTRRDHAVSSKNRCPKKSDRSNEFLHRYSLRSDDGDDPNEQRRGGIVFYK
jgi:hypothetical protein